MLHLSYLGLRRPWLGPQPPSATPSAASRAHDAFRTSRQQFTTLFNKLGNKDKDRDLDISSPPQTSVSASSHHQSTLPENTLSRTTSRGGSPPSSHLPSATTPALSAQEHANQTARLVKAKNEAERSDSEYRRSVIWLETLRMRRVITEHCDNTQLTCSPIRERKSAPSCCHFSVGVCQRA